MTTTPVSSARRASAVGCLGILLACAGLSASAAETAVAFDSFVIEPPFQVQDVLHGRFAEAPSLLLLGEASDDADAAVYAIHTLADAGEAASWREVHRGTLPEGTVLADRITIAGADRLLAFDGERIRFLDPADWQFKPLGIPSLPTLYRGEPHGVATVDVAKDANGDGRDDLVLPDLDGLWVVLQDVVGGFAEPAKLPVAPAMRVGDSVAFSVPPTFGLDYDGDGHGDLAVLDDDTFVVFKDAGVETAPAALVVPGGLTGFDAPPDPDGGQARGLNDLADHNGDGIADLSVDVAQGGDDIMDVQSATHFHFGRREGAATVFHAEPDAVFDTGAVTGVEMTDIDGDGLQDAVVLRGEFSVRKLVSALVTRSMSLDLAVYRMGSDGFAAEPNATRKVKVGQNSGEGVFADINGDGRKDMVRRTEDGVEVLLAEDSAQLFPRRPLEVELASLLNDEEAGSFVAADLDGDGKDDLLAHRAGTAVTILMSR